MAKYWSTIILLFIYSANCEYKCPAPEVIYPCTCKHNLYINIDCEGPDIQTIKYIFQNTLANYTITKLTINSTNIKSLDRIHNYEIKEVEIMNNKYLKYVYPDALKDTENYLEKITFYENAQLNNSAFELIKNLKKWNYIKLINNNLTLIPENAFNNKNNSQLIYIIDDNLLHIETKAFNNLSHMYEIELHIPYVKTISNYSFNNIDSLFSLDIYADRLEVIGSNSFNELKNINNIDIFGMGKYHMKSISPNSFNKLQNVKHINLNNLNIRLLSENSFVDSSNIELIDLSENFIQNLPQQTFKNLSLIKKISLSGNELESFASNSFDINGKIDINLENNRLRYLSEDTFKHILESSNNQLMVKGNNFTCDCRSKWIVEHKQPRYNISDMFCREQSVYIINLSSEDLVPC